MSDYLDTLKHEFEARDDSFLIQLRSHLRWDKTSFSRLVLAMKTYCENDAGAEFVEHWIATGFWYIPQFTRDWTTHPNFSRVQSEDYYQKAYQLLDDLAYWFFMGVSPYGDGIEIEFM